MRYIVSHPAHFCNFRRPWSRNRNDGDRLPPSPRFPPGNISRKTIWRGLNSCPAMNKYPRQAKWNAPLLDLWHGAQDRLYAWLFQS
jgi:hypothetical protein